MPAAPPRWRGGAGIDGRERWTGRTSAGCLLRTDRGISARRPPPESPPAPSEQAFLARGRVIGPSPQVRALGRSSDPRSDSLTVSDITRIMGDVAAGEPVGRQPTGPDRRCRVRSRVRAPATGPASRSLHERSSARSRRDPAISRVRATGRGRQSVGARTRSTRSPSPGGCRRLAALLRHDEMPAGMVGAAISRSRSGRAASRSQSTARRSSSRDGDAAGGRQVALDVLHRARQHVQLVVEVVERRLRHHELALAERQLPGPLARHPVPLAAAGRAELSGAARPRPLGQRLVGTIDSDAIPS